MEMAFLLGRGCSAEILHRAAALAAAADCNPSDFLIKHGLLSEDRYYRALAAELGLPYLAKPRLSDAARFPTSILAGIAPLDGRSPGFVIAPREPHLARLLSRRRDLAGNLAVTTPSALTEAVLRARSGEIAHRAAHRLPDLDRALSSRDGSTSAQLAALCAAVSLLTFTTALAPHLVLTALAFGSSVLFTGMVLLRLATACIDNPPVAREPTRRIPDAALPVYSVVVALYRENRIVEDLVAALSALDYPPTKLDIKLVIEADDGETAAALARAALPPFIEVIVAPPGLPRTKPRALNVALPLLRGQITVVYDAEDVPDPGQLRLAAARFAALPPDVACLQGRLGIYNAAENWLTRLFAIEYASLFDVVNPGLLALRFPIPLGGTSNHFRTAVLDALCGWDAWNVTEDADLGIRLARMGYRVADLPSLTLEEAPVALGGWMRQRSRWMKGFIQTCITHSREPVKALRQLGLGPFCGAVTMTLGAVLSALGYPIFTVVALIGLGRSNDGGGPLLLLSYGGLAVFGLGMASMVVPAAMALKRRRLWRLLAWVPLLPVYYALVSIAAWRAVWELVRDPFRWNKTDHGLARASRARAVRDAPRDPAQPLPAPG